jgi:hypothetical protein
LKAAPMRHKTRILSAWTAVISQLIIDMAD